MKAKEISKPEILDTAMHLINEARSSIKMTMEASEELMGPLPQKYFALLDQKMDEGVKVIRVGFGKSSDFKKLSNRVHIKNRMYTFFHTHNNDYQRMLCIDDKQLMFVKITDGERKVIFTDDPATVGKFKRYFETQLRDLE